MKTQIDMSNELVLHRHYNGVQLQRPSYDTSELSLNDLSKKRISVFFKDKNHIMLHANYHQLECINACSLSDIIGKKFIEIIDDTTLNRRLEYNNNCVMQTQKTLFFSENIETDHLTTKAISVKMPFYDQHNQIQGIFGFAYITETPCAPSNPLEFSDTANAFFENSVTSLNKQCILNENNSPYSQREIDLIRLIVRGKTLRECAAIMQISTRTAEHYFANIKNKAGVKTRSAAIEKLMEFNL